jgi:hypothetical protein
MPYPEFGSLVVNFYFSSLLLIKADSGPQSSTIVLLVFNGLEVI